MPQFGIDELVAWCEHIDLRGRGGAGFPLATKLRTVQEAASERGCRPHVVINGEEGEPASVKDRALLTLCPDLVLDGARLVADALEAERIHAYVSDPACRQTLGDRIAARKESATVDVFAATSGYVSGEETAAVRALSGGPAKPTAKPPRPFTEGVGGVPTLVSNVETLAQLAVSVCHGDASAPSASRGTVLLTVVTEDGEPTLAEVPVGTRLRTVLQRLSLWPADRHPEVILGGFFGGFVPADGFEMPMSHQNMRELGLSLGCGIVIVLTTVCPVTAVAEILHYLDLENAHQCGPCFRGIPAMLSGVEGLAAGACTNEVLEQLQKWSVSLRGRGACGTLDAATGLLGSLLDHNTDLVHDHLSAVCRTCAENTARTPATRWAIPGPIHLKEEQL